MFQPPLIHGKTPAKIRENDKERTEVILNAGYRVIEQWECQWNQLKETDPEIKEFVRKFDCLPQKFSTLETFLNVVLKEKVYGIAEIDIHVPDHLKEHFKELPPIFKNTTVERQHLSAEMQDYAKEFGFDEKRMEMSCRQLLWRKDNVIYRLHQVVFRTWFGCYKMLPVSLLQKSTTLQRFFGLCNRKQASRRCRQVAQCDCRNIQTYWKQRIWHPTHK